MKLQVIGYTLGVLVVILGLAEMVPAIIDWRLGHPNANVFLFNGIICLFFGGSLLITNRHRHFEMGVREAFLLTTLSWLVVSLFAALPFYMADIDANFTDAFFEAVSGLTTTGATVFTGLDQMSHGLLLWRSMIQWIGGVGIVAYAIILLPFLKVGGMHLFYTEFSDRSDKVMPRSSEVVMSLLKVYLLLSALCAAVYSFLGMSGFDAINHAMTTLSTGGFSTHDASFIFFENPALAYASSIFMVCGAIPFVLFIKFVFQGQFNFFKDEQVKTLLLIVIVLTLVLTIWLRLYSAYSLETSFRYALFSIVSVITTTGYAISDYNVWGSFAVVFFLLLTYVGGCAGSTSGGLKMMRIIIAARVVGRQFKTLLYPNGVFVLNYEGRQLDDYTVSTVLGFLSLYVVANVAITILLAFTGLDFTTAISGAATALANVGPGLGANIGPVGNFVNVPDSAKWILAMAMILGRLEIMTVAVIFSRAYWQR